MSQISLKDVAAKAGVSLPTVSKVLRGKGTVSPQTRAAIVQAAEALGYVPNVVARSLVSQKTSTIGIVVSDFSDAVLSQIFVGACQEVDQQGLSILIGGVDPAVEQSLHHLRTLLERRVDGILFLAPHLEKEAQIAETLQDRLPVVCSHPLTNVRFSMVGTDGVLTGRLPTQHLVDLGHTRIGTITGRLTRSVAQYRLSGYRQALESANIPYHAEWVEEGDWQITGGYEATRRLWERAPELTALYAHNDAMAIGALSALRDLGVHVPNDFSVIGCDNIPVAAYTFPALTTVNQPLRDIGEIAIKVLLEHINQPLTEPQQIFLPVHLIVRNSTGHCPPLAT